MKKILFAALAFTSVVGFTSCSDVLDEQPRSQYDPTFFETEEGVRGGLTALYSHLRDMYGQAYYYNSLETGTDEYTYGQSADGNFKDADLSGVGVLNSTSCRADVLWGTAFPYINTANGVIENGTAANMDEALIAEARFFRAFDYFQLVQTFGGVPLDLGSGELKFNTSPVRTSARNTVPEVYTKAIFPDLKTCVEKLPDAGRVTGGVTKTLARLTLAKAYLTYAWWLKNPNGIPTYPECDRTDPDGHDAAWYFQQAYDLALTAINNPAGFGLQPTYYDVNLAANDRNNEILLYADHTEASEQYNGGSLGYGGGGAPDNFASWMGCWNYTQITIAGSDGNNFNPVQRDCVQALGRPWTRMAPVQEVFTQIFADKTLDSRYDGTFTYCFRANWQKSGAGPATAVGANGMTIRPGAFGNYATDLDKNCGFGDAVLTFLPEETPGVDYAAAAGKSNVGGVLPGRADFVINPSGISRIAYPVLWKLGPYRTDNGTGFGPGVNAGSTRPYPIVKFSELYFIAAEAAVMGATGSKSARDLINVIRARAGVWRWDNNGGVAKNENNSAAMVAATPAVITIDYILDERAREYFGEGVRWLDLARTQTWEKRAAKYTICGSDYNDHTPQVYHRTITKDMYLRPIPQGQLDGLEMTAEEKANYQNPAYR